MNGEKSMSVHHVTDDTFTAEVLDHEGLVLVDFWAQWCGPCRAIAPLLDQLAEKYDGKVKICKVDIDKNPEAPSQYGVRSIPTLMLFQKGQNVDTQVGALPMPVFESWIGKHMAS